MMETPEQLLSQVGNFGLYQKRTLITIYLITFLIGQSVMMCSIFIVFSPPHRCYIPEIDDNMNNTQLHQTLPETPENINPNISEHQSTLELSRYIPTETGPDGTLRWSQCYRYQDTISNGTLYSNSTHIKCDNGWRYFAKPGLLTAVTEFNLVCDRAWLGPFATSVQMIGFLFGNIGEGYFSDRFGRRVVYLLSCFFLILSSLIICFMPIWEATFPFWFIIGTCYLGRSTTPVVIINELIPVKHRYASNSLNMIANACGFMFIPFLNYFFPNWRHYMQLHAGLQAIALVPLYFFVKESLKWLLQNKMFDKATVLLKEIGKVNNKEFTENIKLLPTPAIQEKKEDKRMVKKRLTYIDLAKISFLRKRVVILAIAWIAVTSNYYGLSINTNGLGGDRYIASLLAGAVELPASLLSYFGLKKIGGRLSFMFMIGISGTILIITPFLFKVNQVAVIASNMVGKLFATGSFALLYVFAGDFFPTLLRVQSYGATAFPSRITSMLIPYLVYAGDRYIKALPYLTLGSCAIIAAVGMYFMPETRNAVLPDTIEDAQRQNKTRRTTELELKARTTKSVRFSAKETSIFDKDSKTRQCFPFSTTAKEIVEDSLMQMHE